MPSNGRPMEEEEEEYCSQSVQNLCRKRREILDDLDVYGKIIFKWLRNKFSSTMWIIFFTFSIGCVVGFCEYNNEPSGYIQGEEFLVAERLLASEKGFCFKMLGSSIVRLIVCYNLI
jgi:hypothetical protein